MFSNHTLLQFIFDDHHDDNKYNIDKDNPILFIHLHAWKNAKRLS